MPPEIGSWKSAMGTTWSRSPDPPSKDPARLRPSTAGPPPQGQRDQGRDRLSCRLPPCLDMVREGDEAGPRRPPPRAAAGWVATGGEQAQGPRPPPPISREAATIMSARLVMAVRAGFRVRRDGPSVLSAGRRGFGAVSWEGKRQPIWRKHHEYVQVLGSHCDLSPAPAECGRECR